MTTTMDVYVKGKKVFSYVRGDDAFTASDVKVCVNDVDVCEKAHDEGFESAAEQYEYGEY